MIAQDDGLYEKPLDGGKLSVPDFTADLYSTCMLPLAHPTKSSFCGTSCLCISLILTQAKLIVLLYELLQHHMHICILGTLNSLFEYMFTP